MVLYVYNSQMVLQGIIEQFTSLVWTRKYWDCGEFKLLVPFTQDHNRLIQTGNIIMKHGDNEAAEIQYISISKNLEGYEVIEVQGKFLTHWMSKRLVLNPLVNVNARTQELIRRMVNENCIATDDERVIPHLSMGNDTIIDTEPIEYNSEEYDNLLDAVVDLAQHAKMGFKITTDRATGEHTFSTYKGVDYTDDNTSGNPPCIFSQEYDNVLEQEYTKSIEKHKNTAYVTGEEPKEDSGEERKVIVLNPSNTGLDRCEVMISGSDIKKEYKDDNDVDVVLTDDEYVAALTDRGKEKIAQYEISQAFSSEINTRANLRYREDFDVGDKVTCINRTWNIKINARITEISETYEVGNDGLELTFGESIPSIYKQIKSMAK